MAISNSTRIGTASNLAEGGTYDLLLVKFEGDYPETQVSFGLYNTPMKITGLQKVAQTFMKLLLTSKGSDPFYPNRGTFFPNLAIGANQYLENQSYIESIREAILDGETQTKECLNSTNADLSSCLDRIEILGLDKVDDSLVLYISLTTSAGQNAPIAVPFPEFGLSS